MKRFGERVALFAGIGFGVIALLICGTAGNGLLFCVGIIPLCLWAFAPAAAQAMMSRRVTPQEQGELQGAIGSVRGLSAPVGPLLFTAAFAIASRTASRAQRSISPLRFSALPSSVLRGHREEEEPGGHCRSSMMMNVSERVRRYPLHAIAAGATPPDDRGA